MTDAQGWELPEGDRLAEWIGALPATASNFALRDPEGILTRHADGATALLNSNGTLDWNSPESGALHGRALAESPTTGFLYVAMAPNARAIKGRILEFVPPVRNGDADPNAAQFDVGLFLQAGNPAKPDDHASSLAPAKDADWLSEPVALAVDASGILWVAGHDETVQPARDALYAVPTDGGWRGRPWRILRAPDTVHILALSNAGTGIIMTVQSGGEMQRMVLHHADTARP